MCNIVFSFTSTSSVLKLEGLHFFFFVSGLLTLDTHVLESNTELLKYTDALVPPSEIQIYCFAMGHSHFVKLGVGLELRSFTLFEY